MSTNETRFKQFWSFIQERHRIYLKKEAGDPKPWTTDKLLQQYRFCNVHRENDTVTKWIFKHWMKPNRSEKDLWFASAVARFINWPETLEEIGFPTPWNSETVRLNLRAIKDEGRKVFTGAYIVSTNGSTKPKIDYIIDEVLNPLWKHREELRPRINSLDGFALRLQKMNGVGSFMVGQIVADIKHFDPILKGAWDWHTFAVSGPGSRRGLNILLGYPEKQSWKESEWKDSLLELYDKIDVLVRKAKMPMIDCQNLQNCLCEYSKYVRGYSRSTYPGMAETKRLF